METTRYFLQPHVFLCASSRYVVLLDVRRDRYMCVLRKRFDALSPWLSGWPREQILDGVHSHSLPQDAVARLASPFVSQGILTLQADGSKSVSPLSIPTPTTTDPIAGRPPLRTVLAQTAIFLMACRRADIALTHRSFERVIRTVDVRRLARETDVVISSERVFRLVEAFRALRPLYPRPYLCTFDSLALIEFLAWHRFYPRWVFGVRADPFYAHCWVQHGETLLNDRLDRILRLVPIMAV